MDKWVLWRWEKKNQSGDSYGEQGIERVESLYNTFWETGWPCQDHTSRSRKATIYSIDRSGQYKTELDLLEVRRQQTWKARDGKIIAVEHVATKHKWWKSSGDPACAYK